VSTIHRVLIVEDDSRVRAALTDLLAGTEDFVVTAAVGTAAAAHTVLATAPVDRVLLDVYLPHSDDGMTLIQALSRRYPVIALSIDGTNRTAALRAGATAYLEKDGNPEDILQALRERAHRSRPSS
jgi:two-component system nitrate/nitrite response regulator NarL